MADTPTDVLDGPQITPEDFDADEPQAAPEPSPETKTEEVAKDAEEPAKGDDTPAEPETPPEAEDKPEEPLPEDKPQGKAEERKTQLNTEIRDLVSQRNAIRTEVEKLNADTYQVATEDELVAQGMDPLTAKVEALDQRSQLSDYNNKVADAQLTLESESQRVLREFPMFDENSTEFNKDLTAQASSLLQESLEFDPNTGQVTGSKVSPYQLYKTLATAAQASKTDGQIEGQKAAEKQLANSDTLPGAAPPKEKKDPVLEIWDDDSL